MDKGGGINFFRFCADVFYEDDPLSKMQQLCTPKNS